MDDIIEKFEIATIDKFIKYLSYNSFMKILLDKVKDSFILSFNNTNEKYNFKIETRPDPLALENLRTREFILSSKTVENLRGNLRYELLSGLEAHESIDAIKRRLDKIFVTNTVNTERIARTECLHSLNAGRFSAYKASGVVEYKMWISANDKRTSALCRRMRGQIQKIDDAFRDPNNRDDQWMHPPAHPNCRSSIIPLTRLPDNVITISGQMYAADKKLGKVELSINLLKSQQKRKAWVVRFANGYAVQCFEDEADADYFIETSQKKDTGWFDFGGKVYREVKSGWSVEKKGTKITFKTDGESSKVNKLEIDTGSLNKREITVKGFHDKKGRWHPSHKRKIRDVTPKEVESKEPISMTPENVKEILSLEDLGMKGGVHHQHTHILKLTDNSYTIYKDMDEEPIFGEVSTYEINELLDWDIVPETVSGDFGYGDGTSQRIIEGGKSPVSPSRSSIDCVRAEKKHFDDIAKIFVLDLITGNNDRTGGNTIITDDKVYAIDNEFFGCPGMSTSSLKVLDELTQTGYFNRNDAAWSDSTPMFSWLALLKYDNPDIYKELNLLVIKHFKHVINRESEIIKYYSDDKYKNVFMDNGDTLMADVVDVIKENFTSIKAYVKKYKDKT